MAASEVSLAAPTLESHPGGFSAGPAVSFPASPLETMIPMRQGRRGTPAGLRRALPPPSPPLCPLLPPVLAPMGFCGCGKGSLVVCFGGVGSPREVPMGFGLGLGPWGWG